MAAANPASTAEDGGSRLWRTVFRMVLGIPRSVMEVVRRKVPNNPITEVLIVGRKTGIERSYLFGVFEIAGKWYVGHPNGRSQWSRNLEVVGRATVVLDGHRVPMKATILDAGSERSAVIAATATSPFPAGLVYGAARAHIERVGTYFRLEPVG
jgi:hypothetical protein